MRKGGDRNAMSTAVASAKIRLPSPPSLSRERLNAKLAAVWSHRLALIVAPAGYGKTTAAANFVAASNVPTAWYRLEALDSDEVRLLAHLERAMHRAVPQLRGQWESVADASEALEVASQGRLLLVIDDLHTIEGTPAEAALERFIEYAPNSLRIVGMTRVAPGFNMARLRVQDDLVEISADDLRFRQWETEQLFRDFYRQRLDPEELAELTRRTDGWAAGLQLFHLATREHTREERRRVLGGLGSHSRLVREFLTRNVLEQLPSEVRRFLVATSVLGRLSGELCDRYLDRTGSHALLVDLQRRRVFVQSLDGDSSFRCHEVLRSHLEAMLSEEAGEAAVRNASRRAGDLLKDAGALPEALRAYSRAEDGDSVRRLLGRQGSRIANEPGRWIDELPSALLENDPWLLLAAARRHASEGRPATALETYRRAESGFSGSSVAAVCRDERINLQAWIEPSSAIGRCDHWSAPLRALLRENRLTAEQPDNADSVRLACALASLLRGEFAAASAQAATEAPPTSNTQVHILRVIGGIARLVLGDAAGLDDLRAAEEHAEVAGAGWLARVARAATSISGTDGTREMAASVRQLCIRDHDRWGEAVAALFLGWGAIERGEAPVAMLRSANECFQTLGAAVPAAWARALLALAMVRAGDSGARAEALRAERHARGLRLSAAAERAQTALAAEPGTAPVTVVARTAVATAPLHAVEVSIFGGLRVRIDGDELDLTAAKPRVRSLLRLLAAFAGEPVHREVICEALWPEASPEAALRSLQVAVSSLRQLGEPDRRSAVLVARDGPSYNLGPGTSCDMASMRRDLAVAQARAKAGDVAAASAAFLTAAALLETQLLPEEGPADWASAIRERCTAAAVLAAEVVAASALDRGDSRLAALVARRALGIDRFHDALWQILLRALHRSGEQAAVARERLRYQRVLAELGLTGTEATRAGSLTVVAQ